MCCCSVDDEKTRRLIVATEQQHTLKERIERENWINNFKAKTNGLYFHYPEKNSSRLFKQFKSLEIFLSIKIMGACIIVKLNTFVTLVSSTKCKYRVID